VPAPKAAVYTRHGPPEVVRWSRCRPISIVEAYRYVETGREVGSAVITV
jgi:hypothetical protein